MLDTQGNMMIFLRWMLVVVQGLNFIVFEYIGRHWDKKHISMYLLTSFKKNLKPKHVIWNIY